MRDHSKQKVWRCPHCRILHRGFQLEECRNRDCPGERRERRESAKVEQVPPVVAVPGREQKSLF